MTRSCRQSHSFAPFLVAGVVAGALGCASAPVPPTPAASPANAAARATPATRPLVPAFYIEGTYQGQPATVLVTTSNGDPGRVDLWVFPRDNCSSPPLATERVR